MKLSVAAVQMESRNGDFEGNRIRAEGHIEEAVNRGARLISLPEFALAGYIFDDSIWNQAEPLKGRTYQWLKGLCDRHKVYIATCILENDGEDFFDTFILCGPDNQLWTHRKIEPAAYEAYFFKGAGPNQNSFDTPLGKIGIVICFDTSKTYSINSFLQDRPDVLLLLYSYPELAPFSPEKEKKNWIEIYKNIPVLFAEHLGVPVISCNKTGKFSTSIPFGLGLKYTTNFVDHSYIIDGSGTVLASISKKPGVICTEIESGGADPVPNNPISEGRWYLPYSSFVRFATEYAQKTGKLRYRFSRKRKKAALNLQG